MQLVGHEHENAFERKEDFDSESDYLSFSGKIFNDEKKPGLSGYQSFLFDLSLKSGKIKRYLWKDNYYDNSFSKDFNYNNIKIKDFNINESFLEKLNKVSVPFAESRSNLKLTDIFIYPHIELLDIKQRYMESYFDSKSLLGDTSKNNCILDGDSKIGKSSLLKIFCMEMYNKNKYPILLDAKLIKENDVEKIIKKQFKETY